MHTDSPRDACPYTASATALNSTWLETAVRVEQRTAVTSHLPKVVMS